MFSLWMCLVVLAVSGISAQRGSEGATPGEAFLGVWSGTWEGDGRTGGIELTLEKAKDGRIGGRLSVTGEPTYQVVLRSASFDGAKMTATYDVPQEENVAVALEATFEGKGAKGTWAARDKGTGGELATGTWTVTQK